MAKKTTAQCAFGPLVAHAWEPLSLYLLHWSCTCLMLLHLAPLHKSLPFSALIRDIICIVFKRIQT